MWMKINREALQIVKHENESALDSEELLVERVSMQTKTMLNSSPAWGVLESKSEGWLVAGLESVGWVLVQQYWLEE